MGNYLFTFFKNYFSEKRSLIILIFILLFTGFIHSQNLSSQAIILHDSVFSLEVQANDLGQFSYEELNKMHLNGGTESDLDYEKWRLPSLEELFFIYKNMEVVPNLTSGNYWSRDYNVFDYSNYERKMPRYFTTDWLFNFKTGIKHNNYGKTRSGEKFYVRLVRKSTFQLWKPYSSMLITGGGPSRVSTRFLPEKYTGEAVDYYETGQISARISYLNGEKDRVYYLYYPNGQVKVKAFFVRGQQDGVHLSFWPNGEIETKAVYKDGKLHGKWERFNQNGKLDHSVTYYNGKIINNEVRKFRENGTCYEYTNYIDEKNYTFQSFFENGQICQNDVVRNDLFVTRELYYNNGELMKREDSENGVLKSVWIKPDLPNEYVYYKNQKYGLRDSSGIAITDAVYDSIGFFNSKNISVFSFSNKYGLIDCFGKVILKPIYEALYRNTLDKEGLSYFVKDNGRIGLFDYKGNTLIPVIYDKIFTQESTENSITANYFVVLKGKYGIIDNSGKVLIPVVYESITPKGAFYIVNQNTLFGVIDKKGASILPIRFSSVDKLENSLFLVKTSKYGVITEQNKFILQPAYDSIGLILNYGYLVKQNGLYGVLSKSGLVIVPAKYKKIQLSSYDNIPYRAADVAYCLSGNRVQAYSLSTGKLLDGEDRILKSNNITDDIYSNSMKDIACKFPVKLPALTWRFYDNREPCDWCQRYYRRYSLNNSSKSILFEKRYRSEIYLNDVLIEHFNEINANEEHRDFDISRMNKILTDLYGDASMFESMALTYGVVMRQYAIGLSNMFSSFLGKGIDIPDLKYGEIPRYTEDSKFCSDKCEWESKRSRN